MICRPGVPSTRSEAPFGQTQRWVKAGVFEDLLRELAGRNPQPSAAIFDGRTLQSSPESGERAGYDGHKMKKGSKVHLAVDTLGQLLAAGVQAPPSQTGIELANWN